MKKYRSQFSEAINRMFPTVESYESFKNSHHSELTEQIMDRLLAYAHMFNYIQERREAELVQWIRALSMSRNTDHLNYVVFSDAIATIAQGASVNNLVDWLNVVAEDLGFPKVQASMITRLKQNSQFRTIRQQLLMRLIAFWVGLKRPQLPYTYQTLTGTPTDTHAIVEEEADEDEGVRLDLTFQKHGEIIDFQMIEWLKNELNHIIHDMNLFIVVGKKVLFQSTTTASLKIKKARGPSLEPRLYSQAMRHALVIAHQIITRWAISPFNRKQIPMVVGIAAGKFTKLSSQLQYVIDANLPENHTIRLTDFAKLCIGMTDAKIIFHSKPETYKTPHGDLSIWVIKHFWFLYFDFIPQMLDRDMIPVDIVSYEHFQQSIHFPNIEPTSINGTAILFALRKFPQNETLIIETAKVCLAKRMFQESNTILSSVFAYNPFNPVARSLRMLIYLNMAMEQKDMSVFELYFENAKKEGDFVLKYCPEDEEIWCEYGLLYWTRAIYILRQLRTHAIKNQPERLAFKERLLSDFKEAEDCFQNGMIFSPTVNRPGFWIVHLKSLHELIRHDETITESTTAIQDTLAIYSFESTKFFISLGWIEPAVLEITNSQEIISHLEAFIKRMSQAIQTYDGSVHLRMYKPNVSYSIATVLWDFSPLITVGIAKSTMEWLEKARHQARQLCETNTGIFSIISWYSHIQDPIHFIDCVTSAIKKIHDFVDTHLDKADDYLIDKDRLDGFKLFPLFFDEDIKSGILFQ